MTMTRTQFPKELEEGLNTVFGMSYTSWPQEWPMYLDLDTTNKAFVEDQQIVGLGPGQTKTEGANFAVDAGGEGWTARYNIETVALSFLLTEEAEEDGLYGSLGSKYVRSMAEGMIDAKEIKSASILNNAFDTNYPGGDGKPLCSTTHPLWNGGVLINALPTPTDLSETAIEDMLILVGRIKNDRGVPKRVRATKLICDISEEFNAHRVLDSTLRSSMVTTSANTYADTSISNDDNVIKSMGLISGGVVGLHYLTDSDAFFLKTDVQDGLKMMTRLKIRRGMAIDPKTGNMQYRSRERYIPGFTDPRGCIGNSGG